MEHEALKSAEQPTPKGATNSLLTAILITAAAAGLVLAYYYSNTLAFRIISRLAWICWAGFMVVSTKENSIVVAALLAIFVIFPAKELYDMLISLF